MVFDIVSKILDNHAIFSGYMNINIENMFGISRRRYHAMYGMISIRYYKLIYTTSRLSEVMTLCVRPGRAVSLKQKHQYTH